MSNDIKTKQYFAKMKDMKLSESSRSRMENSLLAYAQFHGVKEGVRVGKDSRSIAQVPQRTSIFNLLRPKSMTAAIIAIALIAGGGTSYAAEGAVPGDFLYPVKIEVNENIKSALAVSNEAEARLQARLAEERLEEAEELAARGALTAETATEISARLKTHAEEAEERSAKAEAEGEYESSATVRASLEGSFRAYADIIAELNGSVSGNNGASLVTDIRAYAESSAEAQASATATIETSVAAKPAAEATLDRAGNIIAEVTTKLERAESEISAEAYTQVEAKLDAAVAAHVEAQKSFRAEVYKASYAAAQTAIRIASEAEAMINSALRIGVDISTQSRPGDPIPNIDITIGQDSGDGNTRLETSTDVNEAGDTEAGEKETREDTETSAGVEADTSLDVGIDTEVIDAGVEADTSARGDLNL